MSAVANRYAEALFSLALDKKSVGEFKNDLDNVLLCLNEVDNVKNFFGSEKVSKENKKEIIKKSFESKIQKDVLNFLYLLVDKGRIVYFDEIIREYHSMANHELGIKEGIIETARPIDESKINELEKVLSSEDQKVELKTKINKSLISGFKITFEDEVIDASMKDKFNKLNNMLHRKGGNPWN